jgi:hypothetical protein
MILKTKRQAIFTQLRYLNEADLIELNTAGRVLRQLVLALHKAQPPATPCTTPCAT